MNMNIKREIHRIRNKPNLLVHTLASKSITLAFILVNSCFVLTGYSTEGSYSVLLPDGRIMTVTYSVPDTETGFLAEVSYEVQLPLEQLKT